MIALTVNGKPTTLEPNQSVHDLVLSIAPSTRGVAVAVNAEVIPKSAWATTYFSATDQVEILTAAAGG